MGYTGVATFNGVPGVPQANPRLGIGRNMECFGNEGPGSLFPVPHTGVNNWDVTFTKMFPLKKEGRSLSFRLETFNLFNRAQYSLPLEEIWLPGTPATPAAAAAPPRIEPQVSTASTTPIGTGTPREIQFALRLQF